VRAKRGIKNLKGKMVKETEVEGPWSRSAVKKGIFGWWV